MELEQLLLPEPGVCRMILRGGAQELAAARTGARAASPDLTGEDLEAEAVNRVLLAEISPLYTQAVTEQKLVPVTDPDFSLLAINEAEGFRAQAEFFYLPPLTLGEYTGFVQQVKPHPIRPLTVELEVNQHHGDEDRAADPAGKKALRDRVAAEIYRARCAQARTLAQRALIEQLGDRVSGPLPRALVGGNYFAEQRRFNLRMQAQGINFDQYLAVRGQTVEQFRQELHAQAERKLRSRLGLLLVAEKEGLWPPEEAVQAALAAWDEKRDGERTFAANDARKARQKLAASAAARFILERSTLLDPPARPVMAPAPGR